MSVLKRILRGITWINMNFQKVFRWAQLFMVFSMTYEVVSRYAFNKPTIWSYELTGMILVPLWILSAGYSSALRDEIRLDVIYNKFSVRTQGIVDMFGWLCLFFYVGLVLYYGSLDFRQAVVRMETSMTYWAPVLWPWKLAVPVGCVLLLMQGVVNYTEAIYKAVTGRQLEL